MVRSVPDKSTRKLVQAGGQKREKIVRAACKAGEGRDGLAVRVDDRVERQSDRSKSPLLHHLLLVIDVAVAVGVETSEDEPVHRDLYLGASEHVGFHPAAVGAGVPGEVDEYTSVLLTRYGESRRKVVEPPVQLGGDVSGVDRGRRAADRGEKGFQRTKRSARETRCQPHAKREK